LCEKEVYQKKDALLEKSLVFGKRKASSGGLGPGVDDDVAGGKSAVFALFL
jgi:hypothetical protein